MDLNNLDEITKDLNQLQRLNQAIENIERMLFKASRLTEEDMETRSLVLYFAEDAQTQRTGIFQQIFGGGHSHYHEGDEWKENLEPEGDEPIGEFSAYVTLDAFLHVLNETHRKLKAERAELIERVQNY